MTYETYGLRTRFGVCWLLGMLCVPALALAVQRWLKSGALPDAAAGLWVIAVTMATIRLLVRLGRIEAALERTAKRPDAGTTLAFEAIALLPMLGLVPQLLAAAQR